MALEKRNFYPCGVKKEEEGSPSRFPVRKGKVPPLEPPSL